MPITNLIKNKNTKFYIIFASILLVCTLFLINRSFYAIDNDERVVDLIAIQLAQGHTLFGQCWANHQTSAMIMAPFLYLYILFNNGSTDGIILAYRLISVFISIFIALYIFYILSKCYSRFTAAAISLTLFLWAPYGYINAAYQLLQTWFVSLSVITLLPTFMLDINKFKRNILLIISAIFWSLAVMTYPYLLFVTPFYLIFMYLLFKDNKLKMTISFGVVCFNCAVIFISIVLNQTSLPEFLESVKYILADPTYQIDFPKLLKLFTDISSLIKYAIVLGGALLVYFVLRYIVKYNDSSLCTKSNFIILFNISLYFAYFLIYFGAELTGIYTFGFIGLNTAFFVFSIFSLINNIYLKSKLYTCLSILGILVFCATALQGDVPAHTYVSFNYLSIYSYILISDRFIQKNNEPITKNLHILSIYLFIVALLFCKSTKVREDNNSHSNIFEYREQMPSGALKGIYLYPWQVENLTIKQSIIQNNTKSNDLIFVVSVDELLCLETQGEYMYPLITDNIDGFLNRTLYTDYLNSKYKKKPTKIFFDKQCIDSKNTIDTSLLGKFIEKKYDVENIIENEFFWIYEIA